MSQISERKLNCDGEKSEIENRNITYKDIAAKLLSDKFLLTALELHTELLESGKEVRQLKEFFSDAKNFEIQSIESTAYLSRSGSQGTLDSLDLARYSEDGGGNDERVAVLEFELRKAKETINALRNNLTVATESETNSPKKGDSQNIPVDNIKPHEQRALNFLINEYLLLYGYKLTSITFADENQNQDFDDWDEVGLNIARPPELLSLYRDGLKHNTLNSVSFGTQTDFDDVDETRVDLDELTEKLQALKDRLSDLESQNFNLKNHNTKLQEELNHMSSQITINPNQEATNNPNKNAPKNEKDSVGSDSPERFEMVDKNMVFFKQRGSIGTLDDNISNNSFNTNEWMNLNMPQDIQVENVSQRIDFEKSKSPFTSQVINMCYINVSQNTDKKALEDILNQEYTSDNFVHLASTSLLKIIPNIILNKREEVIPLIIATIHLNSKVSERDKLLQQLFNLKKKPSETERLLILTGLISIAKNSGEHMVENEILPQCWLQLTHKYVERRLLVAEACIALMPYVSSPIRNSLCLSMLQQMLEDKDDVIREKIIKALSLLTCLCDDLDKYYQCEQLAISTLSDSSNSVVNLSSQILFPVLGKWALKTGVLTSSLFKKLLNKLNYYIKDIESPTKVNQSADKILRIVNVIENLLPFLFMYVASHDKILSNIEKDMAMDIRSDFKNICTSLTSPEIFHEGEVNCGMIIYEFEKYVQDNPNISWPEMDWFLDVMLPDLFNNLHHIDVSQQSLLQSFINLFSHICIVFGKNFSKYKIRPFLQAKVQNLEQVISSFNQFCPSLNVIPVYLTVLSYSNDYDELSGVLKKFLCALPLCGSPMDVLEIAVKRLCEADLQETVVECLWSGVVHQRPLVRAASASLFSGIVGVCNHELLKTKVAGALVTLASDTDILVRTAAIPALGSLITDCPLKDIHDKVYMQLQTYLSESNIKDNHTLLRQIIVTLGNIVHSCSTNFLNDVILPQITSFTMFLPQMKNQTRKVDLAQALLESYTQIVYTPLDKNSISSSVLPGLRALETVILENQSLNTLWETLASMIRECENKIESSNSQSQSDLNTRLSYNVNHGVEEVKQRVSKIFTKQSANTKQNPLPNLQGIFKKK